MAKSKKPDLVNNSDRLLLHSLLGKYRDGDAINKGVVEIDKRTNYKTAIQLWHFASYKMGKITLESGEIHNPCMRWQNPLLNLAIVENYIFVEGQSLNAAFGIDYKKDKDHSTSDEFMWVLGQLTESGDSKHHYRLNLDDEGYMRRSSDYLSPSQVVYLLHSFSLHGNNPYADDFLEFLYGKEARFNP